MARYTRFGVYLVLVFALLLAGGNLARAQRPTNGEGITSSTTSLLPFGEQYIQQASYPEDVGSYISLTMNPLSQLPYVSYYDSYNQDLVYAHLMPHGGGNCGTDNNWYCDSIDTGGNVGTATSIDIWSDNIDTYRVGISYHDVTNRSLKYISWTCTGPTCTIKNDVTIDDPATIYVSMGNATSMKFAANGNPVIAYYRSNLLADDALMLAEYVGSSGNCGEGGAAGKWDCTVIDAGEGVGRYVSLDIPAEGMPVIAYYDAGNGDLKYAQYWGIVDPDCYGDNGYFCQALDTSGDVGLFPSVTAQRQIDDQPFRIAYFDNTNHRLKYYDPDFGTVWVDNMGISINPMGISMDVGANGYPYIAYQQITGEFAPARLMIARPALADMGSGIGNCGEAPPGYLFQYWQCDVVDNAGQYLNEAYYVSMEVYPFNRPQIAYSEFFDYDIGDHATSAKFSTQLPLSTFLPICKK